MKQPVYHVSLDITVRAQGWCGRLMNVAEAGTALKVLSPHSPVMHHKVDVV